MKSQAWGPSEHRLAAYLLTQDHSLQVVVSLAQGPSAWSESLGPPGKATRDPHTPVWGRCVARSVLLAPPGPSPPPCRPHVGFLLQQAHPLASIGPSPKDRELPSAWLPCVLELLPCLAFSPWKRAPCCVWPSRLGRG